MPGRYESLLERLASAIDVRLQPAIKIPRSPAFLHGGRLIQLNLGDLHARESLRAQVHSTLRGFGGRRRRSQRRERRQKFQSGGVAGKSAPGIHDGGIPFGYVRSGAHSRDSSGEMLNQLASRTSNFKVDGAAKIRKARVESCL